MDLEKSINILNKNFLLSYNKKNIWSWHISTQTFGISKVMGLSFATH